MRLLLTSVAILALLPSPTLAQTPRLDATGAIVAETGGGAIPGWSPRLTLGLTDRSALEGAALFRPMHTDRFGVGEGSTSWDVVLRQTLWADERTELFGLVGATSRRMTTAYTGNFGSFRNTQTQTGAQIGLAARWVVHPRLALRADIRSMIGEDASLSAGVGLSMPVGRYTQPRTLNPDRHDPVWNGMGIGGAAGAGSGAFAGAIAAWAFCETDECIDSTLGLITASAVIGGALGSVVGGVIDSLIPRRGGDKSPPTSSGAFVSTTGPSTWKPFVGVHYTSQSDDETHLGRGVLVNAGVGRMVGSHVRVEGEVSAARHHRQAGYLEATGTPVVATLRSALLFGPSTATTRPFVSVGAHLTHSRGQMRTRSFTAGPNGLPIEGPLVQHPWRITRPGIEAGVGVDLLRGRYLLRPEARFSATFTDADVDAFRTILEPPLVALRAGLTFGW